MKIWLTVLGFLALFSCSKASIKIYSPEDLKRQFERTFLIPFRCDYKKQLCKLWKDTIWDFDGKE